MDSWHADASLDDSMLAYAQNVDLTERGYLKKRNGVNCLTSGTGAAYYLLGRHTSATNDKLIAHSVPGGVASLYTVNPNGTSQTLLSSGGAVGLPQWMANYAGVSYIVRSSGSNMTYYDGATAGTFSLAGTYGDATHITFFKDRGFTVNSNASWDRVVYSGIAPTPTSGSSFWSNSFDVGSGDGDWLVCTIPFNDALIIFKSRSTWILYGVESSPDEWILKQLNPSLGCISRGACLVHENLLYFESVDGIYRTDGTSFEEVSAPIRDRFINRPNVRTTTPYYDFMAVIDDRLFCFIHPTNLTGTVETYVYNLKVGGWTQYTFASSAINPNGVLVLSDQSPGSLYFGSFDATGRLYQFGLQTLWDDRGSIGTPSYYRCLVQSKLYDMGEPGLWKRMLSSGIDYNGAGFTFSWLNGQFNQPGSQVVTNAVTMTNERYRSFFPVPPAGWFRDVAFQFDHTGSISTSLLEWYGVDMDIKEQHTMNAKENA